MRQRLEIARLFTDNFFIVILSPKRGLLFESFYLDDCQSLMYVISKQRKYLLLNRLLLYCHLSILTVHTLTYKKFESFALG